MRFPPIDTTKSQEHWKQEEAFLIAFFNNTESGIMNIRCGLGSTRVITGVDGNRNGLYIL